MLNKQINYFSVSNSNGVNSNTAAKKFRDNDEVGFQTPTE